MHRITNIIIMRMTGIMSKKIAIIRIDLYSSSVIYLKYHIGQSLAVC